MKIQIYLFVSGLLLASSLPLMAQQGPPSCCALKRQAGQKAFDARKWDKAIEEWNKGTRCTDASKCPDLSGLVAKAKAEKQKQADKDARAAEEARRRQAAQQEEAQRKAQQEAAARKAREEEAARKAQQEEAARKAREEEAARKADDDLYGIAESADVLAAYEAYIKKCVLCRHKSKAEAAIKRLKGPDPGSAPPASNPQPPSNMVRVRGGTFDMGDVMGDKEYDNETVHRVTVADFYIGRTEVTFEEYDRFCEATGRDKPGDAGWGRGKRPVINVSWYDAIEYCNWLSVQHGLTPYYTVDKTRKDPNNTNTRDPLMWTVAPNRGANGYRLPTEAEWEYAAREGGRKVRFGNGKDIADPREINFGASALYKAPYSVVGEYRGRTVPVGSLNSPNALGLHDMSGNVWEWCWDRYGSYSGGAEDNPQGAGQGSNRVIRGGSWLNNPLLCRAANRSHWFPTSRGYVVGFRLARS